MIFKQFFNEGNDIAYHSNRRGGWGEGWAHYEVCRQLKVKDPICGFSGPSLCSQYSKLKIKYFNKPFITYPAVCTPFSKSHGAKTPLMACTGSEMCCYKNQIRDF